jgi:hypothetical protein
MTNNSNDLLTHIEPILGFGRTPLVEVSVGAPAWDVV